MTKEEVFFWEARWKKFRTLVMTIDLTTTRNKRPCSSFLATSWFISARKRLHTGKWKRPRVNPFVSTTLTQPLHKRWSHREMVDPSQSSSQTNSMQLDRAALPRSTSKRKKNALNYLWRKFARKETETENETETVLFHYTNASRGFSPSWGEGKLQSIQSFTTFKLTAGIT